MTNSGCCRDEQKQVKLNFDQHKAAYQQKTNLAPVILLKNDCFYTTAKRIASNNIANRAIQTPPILIHKDFQAFLALYLI